MDGLKILVVDDEARMRKLVKDFLVNKGFSVERQETERKLLTSFSLRRILRWCSLM